ncbi:hypothetical protein AB0K93_16970 [Streptomyces sp. NPDC052676]|uniref:hypothetical protein n=1 Tax=Streptomyces sp. NPDC052676 TaxID=3154953 RepID=UPI00341D43C5
MSPTAVRVLSRTLTVLAAVLVLAALLLPNTVRAVTPGTFVRIPVEAVVGAALLLALPRRPRMVVAALGGLALAALTVLNLLDMGFHEYLGRGFNLVLDWELLDDAQSYAGDTMGRAGAFGLAAGAVVLVLLLCALLALAAVRLGEVLARHRTVAVRSTLAAGGGWAGGAAGGGGVGGGTGGPPHPARTSRNPS